MKREDDTTSSTPSSPARRRVFRRPRPTLVIVGNGMVGHRLCEQLVERGGHRRFSVIVFGDEPRSAYDRVHLTDYFKSADAGRLELAPRSWYAEHRVDLRTGRRVVRIDRDARRVALDDGSTQAYDALVLATGSRPFVPPINGVEQPGVFVYRTIEDLDAIRVHAGGVGGACTRAAIIGGGLLGLEAAQAMAALGVKQVHVVERAGWLMPQQLDEDSAAVLERHVRALGLYVHLRKTTQRIERADGGALRLVFDGGEPLEVDTVVISAGVRARHELAMDAGLECDFGVAGMIVDDELRTTDPNIYAIGECASHRGQTYGLVAPGYRMADTLAANLCRRLGRRRTAFTGGDRSARLKLLGVEMAVYGDYNGPDPAYVWSTTDKRRMLRVRDDRIVGAIVVGQWSEVAQVRVAIDRRRPIKPDAIGRFMTSGTLWDGDESRSVARLPDRSVVCNCKHVTLAVLRTQINAGCGTIDRLARCTGASTVCGSCKPLLAELLGADLTDAGGVGGWRMFAGVSLLALIAAMVTAIAHPIAFADTVQTLRHAIDLLWRDGFWKQVSGYSLLGVSVIALTLSARKRIGWLSRLGSFGWWRVAHGVLGLGTLIVLLAHTGFRMGHNLNLMLMTAFLGLNLVGSAAGLITAMESAERPKLARLARRWRPWLTWGHIVCFWPLPVLVAFHVASVYFF